MRHLNYGNLFRNIFGLTLKTFCKGVKCGFQDYYDSILFST